MKKRFLLNILVLFTVLIMSTGCGGGKYAESGILIIDADEAVSLVLSGEWIFVDAQKATSYAKEHVKGAVNMERKQITVKKHVPNMLVDASALSVAAGDAGLTEKSNLIIYDDNNNMDSARLAWTFMIYGHEGRIKIVSGGLSALKIEGADVTQEKTLVTPAVYNAGEFEPSMLIEKDGVLSLLEDPPENCAVIDVRSEEEYNNGTIPGAIHIEYLKNNFSDVTYRPIQQIRILYKDAGIMPEDTVVIFCKSSIRASQTWAALYDAGYRDLKIYDGAWLEWSADEALPVYVPEVPGEVRIEIQDAS